MINVITKVLYDDGAAILEPFRSRETLRRDYKAVVNRRHAGLRGEQYNYTYKYTYGYYKPGHYTH